MLRRIKCSPWNWPKSFAVLGPFFVGDFVKVWLRPTNAQSTPESYIFFVNIMTSVFAFTDFPSAFPRNEFFLVAPTIAPDTEKPSPRS